FLFRNLPVGRQVKLYPCPKGCSGGYHNPVSGKWNLAADFVCYEHSSALFYEDGVNKHFEPKHYKSFYVAFITIQHLLYIGVSHKQFSIDSKFSENPGEPNSCSFYCRCDKVVNRSSR
ncbi:MAG: hypothetical protein ABIN93_10930, partial [Ginsengibacter sp.]